MKSILQEEAFLVSSLLHYCSLLIKSLTSNAKDTQMLVNHASIPSKMLDFAQRKTNPDITHVLPLQGN